MAKKKEMTKAKEINQEKLNQGMEAKVIRYLILEQQISPLEKEYERLKNEIRSFAEKHFTGYTEKGEEQWTYGIVKVDLAETVRYPVDVRKLIKRAELKKIIPFLEARKEDLLSAVKAGKLPLTEGDLERMLTKKMGKPQVKASFISTKIAEMIKKGLGGGK